MLIIGIDPGISGSICFFEDGEIKDVIDMPTMIDRWEKSCASKTCNYLSIEYPEFTQNISRIYAEYM